MIVVLMGVAGCGKTTVGAMLAGACGWSFHDADDFHSPASVAKMKNGIPLTDEDRKPWLDRLNSLALDAEREGRSIVLACSALKSVYRAHISNNCKAVRFVLLNGSKALISERLAARHGHFMNPLLLDSQFSILEPPADALILDVTPQPTALVGEIRKQLGI
jgi:gluconokinase